MEHLNFIFTLRFGVKMGMSSGDPLKIIEDMQVLKPTIFLAVPRILNRLYAKIYEGIRKLTGCKAWLVNKAIDVKMYHIERNEGYTHKVYDPLVFNKFKQVLGGNVRMMATGSAPIEAHVHSFLMICFCIPVVEGFGMSEVGGGVTTTLFENPVTGTIGGPKTNAKFKLREIPEMNYLTTTTPPRGELMIKGPAVMEGYFNNPEKTAEALQNGWLLTGDVCQINANGSVKIIDRAKSIFKLSQGEYIAPEKLENIYSRSNRILQLWIHGTSL